MHTKSLLTTFVLTTSLATATIATALTPAAAARASTSPQAGDRSASAATVDLRKTGLGNVLVNGSGRTLYLFLADTKGKSACSGSCATYWPPLLSTSKARAKGGVRTALLGTIKRKDGRRQVTYAGHPLYTFAGDRKAGDVTGEGSNNFGALWYALGSNGRAIRSVATASSYGG